MVDTISRYRKARTSAYKIRIVANIIKGKKVSQALEILTFSNKKSALILKKVLESAIANAEHNYCSDIDDLKVKNVFIDTGPSIKRIMIRAKGKSDLICKRTSHITIIVSDQ